MGNQRTFEGFIKNFWRRVDCTDLDSCWPFMGGRNSRNYGSLGWRNPDTGVKRALSAHRVAYESAYGPIPDGKVVMHICDNPPCCNPTHLRLGTTADNNADRAMKGRTYRGPRPNAARGERAPTAKLTADQVREIRALHATGTTQKELQRRYGVKAPAINRIVHRTGWRHVA